MSNNLLLRARGNFDELYTPEYAVTPILQYLKSNSKILCPFDDESTSYTKVLRQAGHEVTSTHQWDGKDFFDYTVEEAKQYDYIISNPPYSTKDKVLEHLYKLNRPFAMLLPISSLEGIKRGAMFTEHGIEVLVLNTRVNFMEGKGKSSYFNTSYFCNNVLPEKIIFHKLIKKLDLR